MGNYNNTKILESNKIYDVLYLIEKHPERYLSSKTITALQDFLNGYLTGNPYPKDMPPFENFSGFLLITTGLEYTDNRNLIARILLHESNGDELKAFNNFFKSLEDYKTGVE